MRSAVIGLGFVAILLQSTGRMDGSEEVRFRAARAIWPEERQLEKNLFVGFHADFENPGVHRKVLLRLTASTIYRAFLNGEFIGYGPARGPHGHVRVDEIDLSPSLAEGTNRVAVEVAGYNVNSYYTIDAPSFLQAEVVSEGDVLAATGGEEKNFSARIIEERVRKVQRYSFQRPFIEVYRLAPGWDRWRRVSEGDEKTVSRAVIANPPRLLPRRVPYPRFYRRPALTEVAKGLIRRGIEVARPWKDRSLVNIGPKLGGYRESELEVIPSLELQTIATASTEELRQPIFAGQVFSLEENSYCILDLGTNLTGFLGATVECSEETRLIITFDEVLRDGDVDFKRLGCVNAVSYELEAGTYRPLESFEAYTLRYLKLIVLEGACSVKNVYLREYTNPDVWEAHFIASDPRLNRLFDAGRETYRQNAVDVFMDCPSRERAGWLCDSFFTARVAKNLSGDTTVEKNFIENYLLAEKFEFLPDGMLPMCYPADHNDGVFIPNWSLWFVVELGEYLARSGDRKTIDALKPRVLKLFDYFEKFRNEDGLLEKLESWVFVEWSKANEFVQDVNYPSNMLYAAALEVAGNLYALSELKKEAESIRDVIRKQAFDGEFFVDNAVRRDGKLRVTTNRTEVCQYFAFFFRVADPTSHPELFKVLVEEFGPKRKETGAHPEVHPANAFVGNMLRLEILSRYGRRRQILDESVAYLLYMADETGTLWENIGSYASCNHGFASHIVHSLYRDVLGVQVDTVRRVVSVSFPEVPAIDWCEGRIPTPEGPVTMRWHREGDRITYRLETPAGYSVGRSENTRIELIREP